MSFSVAPLNTNGIRNLTSNHLLSRLNHIRVRLRDKFPDAPEFKAERKEAEAKAAANNRLGWDIIAHLAWVGAEDGVKTADDVRAAIAVMAMDRVCSPDDWTEARVKERLRHWMAQFATRGRAKSEKLKAATTNELYQVIARGRQCFRQAIRSPEIAEFYIANTQKSVDLPALIEQVADI
ncbi:MAG: hypothetical protein KGL39_01605 [Patescibacteria group bacterium]|nr:hypothetical protein [Patescibacteria group bacterium]